MSGLELFLIFVLIMIIIATLGAIGHNWNAPGNNHEIIKAIKTRDKRALFEAINDWLIQDSW